MAEIQAKIAEVRVERDKLAKDVRPDVLKRYSNIRMRRGLAVVSVGLALGEFLMLLAALGLAVFGIYGLCEARWRKV